MDDADVARYWDGNADVWARHVRAGYDLYRDLYNTPAFLALLGDEMRGATVLDAGCGEGYNTRTFAGLCERIVGVDVSQRMIEYARAEEERAPLGIEYHVRSMNDLAGFPDGSFDAVVSTMALMDCADYEGAARELYRVLRPGGLFAFSVLHPCFIFEHPVWVRDDSGEVVGVTLGDYFGTEEGVERWRFSASPPEDDVELFEVPRFPRLLEGYINPLADVGFRLETLSEPRPTDTACERQPSMRKHRLIPIWLHVKARKVGA
jgi:SAM-dependent methyltransferase